MASNPLTSSPQTILSNRLAVLSIFVMISDMFVYDYTRIKTTEVYQLRHFLARDNSMKVSLHKLALIKIPLLTNISHIDEVAILKNRKYFYYTGEVCWMQVSNRVSH